MDVLFNTIDVRDLLPSPESSSSSQLSAPDLRLLISRLDAHSLKIKSTVRSYLLSHHTDFSSLFSQCSDVVSRSERLSEDVLALLNLISDRPIEEDVRKVVGEIAEKKRELRGKSEILELLGVVLELDRKLEVVRDELQNGNVVEAAEGLRELKKALGVRGNGDAAVAVEGEPVVQKLWHFQPSIVAGKDPGATRNALIAKKLATMSTNVGSNTPISDPLAAKYGLHEMLRINDSITNGKNPKIHGIFRKQWADCFEEIQQLLLRFMGKAVRFENESNAVHIKYRVGIDGIDGLETALKAMDVAEMLDYGFAKVADLITKYVVTPLVTFGETPLFIEAVDEDSGSSGVVVLKMVPSGDPECNKMDGETMYSNIIRIIEFIKKFLCFHNSDWIQCFGRLTWSRMADLIISHFLSKVVPDEPSKLTEFQEIRKLTVDFETALKELNFISSSEIKDEKLGQFADNVEVHFASRKNVQILAKARNILQQSQFNIPQDFSKRASGLNKDEDLTSNVVLLFSSEKCVVSEAAKQLMELVHETLKDVCLLPPKVGLEFYHTARNALVLYEAIVPVKLERQLDSINQAAALMHNDCLYLSQEVLGLAFEYRPYFPSTVKEHAVFIDLGPRFQLMAEEVLQRQIQLVMRNLKQAIDGANGFQNTHQIKQFEAAKFCIDQVSFILEKVHIIWEPLLLPSIYQKCMTMILEAVFSRITKDILLLDDMAADEMLQLQRLIHLLLEQLSSLLEPLVAVDGGEKLVEYQNDNFDNFVVSLRKLRKLADLLDMPLKSITADWESGELSACNFTSLEVEDFIRAIFTDSPLRRECLFRIENSNSGDNER